MLSTGIKRISAITLLYEEAEKRLTTDGEKQPLTFKRLSEISREALRLRDVRIVRLPVMRVLTSKMKDGQKMTLDADNMQNLFLAYGIIPDPGLRNCFYLRKPNDEWIMMAKIQDDFINSSPYIDELFIGGLFAASSSFMEDMTETFVLLKEWISGNEYFELDTDENGALNRDEMIEEILPWDIARKLNRYQQDVFIPVRIKNKGGNI
jgi:hypothetical protein